MNFKTFAIAAAAAASIAISAPASANASDADGFTNTDLVQLVGGKRFHGGKGFHGKRFHGKHFHWGGGHGYKWGWKPYHYGYHGCGWFYRKAKRTGSPYYWNKFKACKYGW